MTPKNKTKSKMFLWGLVLVCILIVIGVLAGVALARGLRHRRTEELVCSTSIPYKCTPEEFAGLCDEDVVTDPTLSLGEQNNMQNGCKWACDELDTRVDLCQFTSCTNFYKRNRFVSICDR